MGGRANLYPPAGGDMTMKCKKCEGRGWNPKHKNCWHGAEETYIRGCNDPRICHACLGTGSTGAVLIKAALLEIKLESTDYKSQKLAEQALREFDEVQL